MIKKLIFILCFLMLVFADAKASDVVIKSTTNRGDVHIGDYWIAEDMAEGFKAIGKKAQVDYRGEYHKKHEPEPKLNVYMRGYTKFGAPFGNGVNVLYCYYPMAYNDKSKDKVEKDALNKRDEMPKDASLDDDWQNYDVIAVASASYAQKLNDEGIKAIYVPQFTNAQKFYPNPDKELETDILFVGSNWHDRTSLRYAIESGYYVAVYGYNWEGIVPYEMYRGNYIENKDLNRYYSSAKIVLNDHRPDMKNFGFINNRIYDATAAGAMVISDYMPEIQQVYGDSVPMYKNKEELKALLDYYLSHEDEREAKAMRAREITLNRFTNTVVAKQLLEVSGL